MVTFSMVYAALTRFAQLAGCKPTTQSRDCKLSRAPSSFEPQAPRRLAAWCSGPPSTCETNTSQTTSNPGCCVRVSLTELRPNGRHASGSSLGNFPGRSDWTANIPSLQAASFPRFGRHNTKSNSDPSSMPSRPLRSRRLRRAVRPQPQKRAISVDRPPKWVVGHPIRHATLRRDQGNMSQKLGFIHAQG